MTISSHTQSIALRDPRPALSRALPTILSLVLLAAVAVAWHAIMGLAFASLR